MNENITHAVAASVATLLAQHGEVLAKLAALDALCEQQTRTIALTSEKVAALEKARDEVGIQLEACQERLRLAMAVVDEARTIYGEGRGRTVETPVGEDGGFVRHDYLIHAEWIDIGLGCALAALGAVPGD
jgi:hypothetical protein